MNFIYKLEFYQTSRTPCILVFDADNPHELFGKLSLFSPLAPSLQDNEFVVKRYSENESWYLEALNLEYFQHTLKWAYLLHVDCPVYRVTPLFIKQQFEATYNPRTDIYECNDILFKLHEKYCERKQT
jgi:hypothetical protein